MRSPSRPSIGRRRGGGSGRARGPRLPGADPRAPAGARRARQGAPRPRHRGGRARRPRGRGRLHDRGLGGRGRRLLAALEVPSLRGGGGAYLVRVDAAAGPTTLVQAPHALSDLDTGPIALDLLLDGDAWPRAVFVSTLGRRWGIDGRRGPADGPADPCHNGEHLLAVATDAALEAVPGLEVIQLHGFADPEASEAEEDDDATADDGVAAAREEEARAPATAADAASHDQARAPSTAADSNAARHDLARAPSTAGDTARDEEARAPSTAADAASHDLARASSTAGDTARDEEARTPSTAADSNAARHDLARASATAADSNAARDEETLAPSTARGDQAPRAPSTARGDQAPRAPSTARGDQAPRAPSPASSGSTATRDDPAPRAPSPAAGLDRARARQDHPAAIVSAGEASPSPRARALRDALEVAVDAPIALYPVDTERLGALTNLQGKAVRRQGRGACFLHVELAPALRRTLRESPAERRRFAAALRLEGSKGEAR
ncbi:MAG: hypothetical protein R3B09_01060 [Nannocystaceae bacterium]